MFIFSQDKQHIINTNCIAEFYINESIAGPNKYCLTALMADMNTARIIGEYPSKQECLSAIQMISNGQKDFCVSEETKIEDKGPEPENNEWGKKIDAVIEKIRGPYMDAYNEGRWRLRFISVSDAEELSEHTCELLKSRSCFSVEDLTNLTENQLKDIRSISGEAYIEIYNLTELLKKDLPGWLGKQKKKDSQPSASSQTDSAESKPVYRACGGEARSQKTLIALTPTMFEEAKERAGKMEISFNEYITRLIDADLHGK